MTPSFHVHNGHASSHVLNNRFNLSLILKIVHRCQSSNCTNCKKFIIIHRDILAGAEIPRADILSMKAYTINKSNKRRQGKIRCTMLHTEPLIYNLSNARLVRIVPLGFVKTIICTNAYAISEEPSGLEYHTLSSLYKSGS